MCRLSFIFFPFVFLGCGVSHGSEGGLSPASGELKLRGGSRGIQGERSLVGGSEAREESRLWLVAVFVPNLS